MGGVGFVPHHANEDHGYKNPAQTVHRQHDQLEHGVAEAFELLSHQRDGGGEDGHGQRHTLGGFVIGAPFGLDVVGDGGGAGQNLAVSGGHGGGKNGRKDQPAKEGVEFAHCETRQTGFSPGHAEFWKQDATSQSDDEHECNERRLPNKEPDHGVLAGFVVLQRHDTGHDLGLAGHAQPAEEEGEDPQRGPELET